MADWPNWWEWELELSSHVLKRMLDRDFTEVDLRTMIECAESVYESDDPGRWIVTTAHDFKSWEVIVEPDQTDQLLVIITAYPLDLS